MFLTKSPMSFYINIDKNEWSWLSYATVRVCAMASGRITGKDCREFCGLNKGSLKEIRLSFVKQLYMQMVC